MSASRRGVLDTPNFCASSLSSRCIPGGNAPVAILSSIASRSDSARVVDRTWRGSDFRLMLIVPIGSPLPLLLQLYDSHRCSGPATQRPLAYKSRFIVYVSSLQLVNRRFPLTRV